jgi:hypothetical protein
MLRLVWQMHVQHVLHVQHGVLHVPDAHSPGPPRLQLAG